MYTRFHVEYPPFFSDFNATWIYLEGFLKNIQISNFIIIRPMRDELLRTDG